MTHRDPTLIPGFTRDVEAALTLICSAHGVPTPDDIIKHLAQVVAVCTGETPSATPEGCRYVVTGSDYPEGHDHLASALNAATTLTHATEADAVTIRRNPTTTPEAPAVATAGVDRTIAA